MRANRSYLVLACLCGLGAALWCARPGDLSEWPAWTFSLFSSAAWFLALLLCVVAAKFNRSSIAIGGLIALGLSELYICLNTRDQFFLMIKPFIQALVLAAGAVIGIPFGGRGRLTPNKSRERARER
jgi:hypothetical protein